MAKPPRWLFTTTTTIELENGSNHADPFCLGLRFMPLTKHEPPVRNQIKPSDVKHWSKHWKVEPDRVRAAISKVGNSVAAVEKELGQPGSKRRHKTSPMESQPVHLDGAMPMAPAPTKRSKGVPATGFTISKEQAELIRRRSLKKQRNQIANSGKR